jgi:hypothetical protein
MHCQMQPSPSQRAKRRIQISVTSHCPAKCLGSESPAEPRQPLARSGLVTRIFSYSLHW